MATPKEKPPALPEEKTLETALDDRKRFTVDLLPRHAEWLERYAHYVAKGDTGAALEKIIRATYAADPTKAGLINSASSMPAAEFKP